MTICEKRKALHDFCNEQMSCVTCKLHDFEYCSKYSEVTAPDDVVEKWYENCYGDVEVEHDTTHVVDEQPDMVNHPDHYESGKFECIDVMIETQGVEAVMNFCICNAFKYLYRHKNKNGVEDLRKARWYIDKYIELWEGQQVGAVESD